MNPRQRMTDEFFATRLGEVREWANTHGRLPRVRGASTPEEVTFGRWLSHFRTLARGGVSTGAPLTAERRAALDERLPGWGDVTPGHHRDEDAFRRNVRELAAYRERTGALPSTRDSFVGHVRDAARGAGNLVLTPERRALLDAMVPGWDADLGAWVRSDEDFRLRVEEVAEYVRAHGRLPASVQGQRLGTFLAMSRWAERHGNGRRWTSDRAALLDERVPGWREGVAHDARAAHFHARVMEVAAYVEDHGELPSRRTGTRGDLGGFLHKARIAARGRGAMAWSPERKALLDQFVPGWEVTRTLDERFRARVAEVADHIRDHGALPSHNGTRPDLYKFLERNRSAARGRRSGGIVWSPKRQAILDELVPGWSEPRARGPRS